MPTLKQILETQKMAQKYFDQILDLKEQGKANSIIAFELKINRYVVDRVVAIARGKGKELPLLSKESWSKRKVMQTQVRKFKTVKKPKITRILKEENYNYESVKEEQIVKEDPDKLKQVNRRFGFELHTTKDFWLFN